MSSSSNPQNTYDEDLDMSEGSDSLYIRSSSPMSDDASMRSIRSYNSSVNSNLLREYGGRKFNTINETYMLPADEEEHTRLDIQHRLLELCLDSLYASPDAVREALAPNQNYPPAILDVGTGSGSWAISMAREFPHAEVVGMDIVAPANLQPIPANCRFEVDDANLPMSHYASCFNVVHVRSVEVGIIDYKNFLNEVALALRPGGVALLVGGDILLYGEDRQPLPDVEPGQPGFSWTHYYLTQMRRAHWKRGARSPHHRSHWTGWLRQNPNYSDVETFFIMIPIGPWTKDASDRLNYISELMRLDALRLLTAVRPLVISDGHDPATVDQWIANATDELQNLKSHLFVRWRFTSARRTMGQWTPADQ